MTNYIFKFFCPLDVSSESLVRAMRMLESELDNAFRKLVFPGLGAIDFKRLSSGVEAGLKSGAFPTFTNDQEANLLTFSGVQLKGPLGPAGHSIWYFFGAFKSDRTDLEALLLRMGPALNALWATISSDAVERQTRLQQQGSAEGAALNGLPRLLNPNRYPSLYTPANLAWINYWSPGAVEAVGQIDAEGFTQMIPLEHGGVVAKVTEEELDFAQAEHLEKMIALYQSHPKIGARDLAAQ